MESSISESDSHPALFQPFKLGPLQLSHRVVLAPLTRLRADAHHTHGAGPNLHDHSHEHHTHEGHSHNMRGVFLHVMAVRPLSPLLPRMLCM